MPAEVTYEASRRIYSSPCTIRFYAGRNFLLDAERAILDAHASALRDKAILDLGVGCGRTTEYLLPMSRDYVGIDFAPAMIDHCRSRFPGVDFRCGDASDLGAFSDGSVDAVLFSFNGVDHAPPARRATIFAEMRRVLRPGGLLVFSSHNLLVDRGSPFATKGRRVLDYLQGVCHYLRNRRHEEYGDDYAMVVDQLDQYRHLMYYITPGAQFAQLRHAGFRDVEAYSQDGSRIGPEDGCRDWWIYYVARKDDEGAAASTQPL
jgi:SAM-dependent methyltransferase